MPIGRWDDKDPADIDDFTIDFVAELGTATISSVTWAVAPSGPTLGASSITGTKATVRITGGTAGTDYVVTATATLSDARVLERSASLYVAQL